MKQVMFLLGLFGINSLLALAMASSNTHVSYSYAEAVYLFKSSDEVDYNAFEINFSQAIDNRFFFTGGYQALVLEVDTGTVSFGTVKNDRTRLSAGIGARFTMSANADFYTSGSLDFYDVDTSTSTLGPGGSLSGDGYTIKSGLRYLFQSHIELAGDFIIQSIDIDDSISSDANKELYLDLGGKYQLAPKFWLGYSFSLSTSDDLSRRHFFFGRYEF